MKRSSLRMRPRPVACLVFTEQEPGAEVTKALFRLGFTVIERAFSDSVAALLQDVRPDVLLVALDPLSAEDQKVLRFLAARADGAPIIVLSTHGSDDALAAALDGGAHAALTTGASATLLGAQVMALWRRTGVADGESVFAIGDLVVDANRRRVSYGGRVIELTRSEFDILAFMARNAGRVLPATEILSGVGQLPGSEAQARAMVKVHLSHLRQKLGPALGDAHISTVRGVGYILEHAGPYPAAYIEATEDEQAAMG